MAPSLHHFVTPQSIDQSKVLTQPHTGRGEATEVTQVFLREQTALGYGPSL